MLTFYEMQQMAQRKGCRLEKAEDSWLSIKTGYILWRDGLWRRLGTLQAVAQYLNRL